MSVAVKETALSGSVAEWAKALDLGSSLSGGVGSSPTTASQTFAFRPSAKHPKRSLLTESVVLGYVQSLPAWVQNPPL